MKLPNRVGNPPPHLPLVVSGEGPLTKVTQEDAGTWKLRQVQDLGKPPQYLALSNAKGFTDGDVIHKKSTRRKKRKRKRSRNLGETMNFQRGGKQK